VGKIRFVLNPFLSMRVNLRTSDYARNSNECPAVTLLRQRAGAPSVKCAPAVNTAKDRQGWDRYFKCLT